jgi:hypothetical protein
MNPHDAGSPELGKDSLKARQATVLASADANHPARIIAASLASILYSAETPSVSA